MSVYMNVNVCVNGQGKASKAEDPDNRIFP